MIRALAALTGMAALAATITACQTYRPPDYDGRNLYIGYCASCHGPIGAGDGPLAAQLIAGDMGDLRRLKAENDGVYPRERLIEMIDGRQLRAAHGTYDMPVWGWQFRREEGTTEEGRLNVEARIRALVDYLETLQVDD
jgi:mono/diheme cytochrome c family protein